MRSFPPVLTLRHWPPFFWEHHNPFGNALKKSFTFFSAILDCLRAILGYQTLWNFFWQRFP